MGHYVALDLEMTGTDLDHDAIIEVGAVRFDDSGILDRYHSLVNPGRPLPQRITALTGITAAAMKKAPPLAGVLAELLAFIDDAPVVGQNVQWDLQFLAREGIKAQGPVYDTALLAELLDPGWPEYSLRTLARQYGVPVADDHRALSDAEAAALLFLKLRARLLERDALVLDEIARLTAPTGWPHRFLFRELAAEAGARARANPSNPQPLDIMPKPAEPTQALAPNQRTKPVTETEIAALFAAAGKDRERFPNFEQRPEQVEMAEAVGRSLSEGGQLVVEAGTGTGKSLAYLVPSALWSLRNNGRVVVTTNTINLQEQIVAKDVPHLRRLLEVGAPKDLRQHADALRVSQLKGRRNYVCLQRLMSLRRQGAATDAEALFLARVLLWLQQTDTGDRSELLLTAEEEALWARVNAQDSNCFAGPSYYVRNGTCLLLRARKRAEASHIVVANHALLLSDAGSGGRALPPYDRLIIDEAHNLEEEATNQFGFQAGQGHFNEYLDGLHTRSGARESGLCADAHNGVRLLGGPTGLRIHEQADGLAAAVDAARARVPELYQAVGGFILRHGEAGGDYDNRLLITSAKRAQPEWSAVELAWENARLTLAKVEEAASRLHTALDSSDSKDILDYDTLLSNAATAVQRGSELRQGVDAVVARADESRIAWLTTNRLTGHVSFSSAPLHVGQVLDAALFDQKDAVVLTSATLSTGGAFTFIKERLGLPDADELLLGSPFDYKRAALVLTPTDMPEPAARGYQEAAEHAIIELAQASKGRALVLFTSHAALRATHRAIKRPLERAGIRVLGQNVDGTAKEILDGLRANPKTVLLGTSSFWEGVDVVGDTLSLLIMAKLPFSVPSDPVYAARSALLDDPFMDYAVPQAGLRFKQGFGRLIRQKSDRGVMVVLDRRLVSKRYGRVFLQSLPPCSISQAPMERLPALVARWLSGRPGAGTVD